MIAAIVPRYLETLRRTPFMRPEKLRDYQHGLLERLLRHARENVPFYRDSGRLDLVFRRDGSFDADRFRDIPVLTRREVQMAGDTLRSADLPAEHGRAFKYTTSGSTSEPIAVWHSELSNGIARTALLLREFEQHGIDPTRRLAYLGPFLPAELDAEGTRRHAHWYPEFAMLGLAGERHDVSDMRPAHELARTLAGIAPDYLRVQPLALQLICANDDSRSRAGGRLRVAMTAGEHFAPDDRKAAGDYLGCRIVESYASNECGRMAVTCPECGRLHLNAEAFHAEAIDDGGGEVGPGATGWLIVTPLYNYAMPLIRYDHADQVVPGESGQCTNLLPVFDTVIGKERTVFRFRGDIAVRPSLPTFAAVELLGAQAFQIAQVAEDRCEFRIVPGRLAPEDMQFEAMTTLLRSLWWRDLVVEYRLVDRIVQSQRAKRALFVREI